MPVHEGVLKGLSRGSQGGDWVHHDFIEIGDTRLKSVRMLSYHDGLLSDAIGQSVALSVAKGGGVSTVVSIRLPDGTVSRANLRGSAFQIFVQGGVFALVVGGLAFLSLEAGLILFWPLAAIALWIVAMNAIAWRRLSAARAAL